MSIRDEFEAALAAYLNRKFPCESVFAEEIRHDRSGDEYVSKLYSGAWWGWQASREALVIELPEERKPRGYGEQVADALGFNDGIRYCRDALTDVGLTVKP